MTYRGRAARRREIKQREFQKRVDAEVAKRPPRVVSVPTTPQIVYSREAGPATAFAVGMHVEHMPIGPDPRKLYSTYSIGPHPDQRQILVELWSPHLRRPLRSGKEIPEISSSTIGIVLRAVRMRIAVETPSHVHRIEWWTWESADHEARHAVSTVHALSRRIVDLAKVPRLMPATDNINTLRGYARSCEILMMELGEYAETLGNAADEWLATPRLDAKPEPEGRSRSRW